MVGEPTNQSGGGAAALYRERLWPGAWVWVAAATAAAALGIAYGAAFGARTGWVIAALVAAVGGLIIWRTASTLLVRDDGLAVDRATLPWWATGQVVVLDAAGVQRARGGEGDHSAYAVVRPGVGPGAVVIEVTDPADPHRTWLIGSRDAQAVASAIQDARGRLTP